MSFAVFGGLPGRQDAEIEAYLGLYRVASRHNRPTLSMAADNCAHQADSSGRDFRDGRVMWR